MNGKTTSGTLAMSANACTTFPWLNATQFLGALNDNIFKLLIIFFLIGKQGADSASQVAATAGAVFVCPFLLFSALAGRLADRFSKRGIIVGTKIMEVGVMALGTLAFVLEQPAALYLMLFLMATQSTLFSPAKYGIIPELVRRERLSQANGMIEMFTYLAIILGTAGACLLPELTSRNYAAAGMCCVGIAGLGLLASRRIVHTAPAGSRRSGSPWVLPDIFRTLMSVRRDGHLLLAVLGAAYFTFLGAFFQLNLIPYGMQALALNQEQSGYLFFVAAIGIGVGALLAGKLSGRTVEFGVVPLGALGLTGSAAALGLIPGSVVAVLTTVFALGFCAGLFIVPIQAFIQLRSPRGGIGEILAAAGFLSWLGVLIASGLLLVLSQILGLSARESFVVVAFLTLALTLIAFRTLPDFLLRFVTLVLVRSVYRIRTVGREHVPTEGGALLVSNHVSWIDALLLIATQQRRIRFVMDRKIYERRPLTPLFRLMGVIPLSSTDPPRQILASLQTARKALDAGYLVCIFAEGMITRDGLLGEFKAGCERIVRGTGHPVIPVYIGGAWGSIFSYAHGEPRLRRPTSFPYPIGIHFGTPLPSSTPTAEVQAAVAELGCSYFEDKKATRESLREAFIKTARKHWKSRAVADTTGRHLTYGEILTAALALGEAVRPEAAKQEKIGLLLPPSVGAALANLAVTLLGRVPVNLNYTTSSVALESAVKQCGIRTILTSRVFLEKIAIRPESVNLIFLEDLLDRLTSLAKCRAWLRARFIPHRRLARSAVFRPADLATVIFSSGSTGEPKGVMLTHHNIVSNIEALRMILRVSTKDRLCAALPFFHSLGFTGTLWLPLLTGCSAVYHANPLEGGKIAGAVREHRLTVLLATPTFLLAYLRRARKADFASLRLVIVGAEKLKPRVADLFEARFGIRPLEGYGATELSPVVAVNVPDTRIGGVLRAGHREGSVGRPLPGVAIKILNPDTFVPVPADEPGLVAVRGPNVMQGYLNRPEKTAEVLSDGWYVTGDIGRMDPDGFLYITDRLARFSKIGGEMVPHGAVEEALLKGLATTEPVLAVTSVPDEKKGEKLMVLHTAGAGRSETLQHILDKSGLPNLWKPARDAYVEIESLPALASGKLDIQGLRQIALQALHHEGFMEAAAK